MILPPEAVPLVQVLSPTFASPLDVKEVAIQVPQVTLPRPGLYRWQVVCAAEAIHERKFPVAQVGG